MGVVARQSAKSSIVSWLGLVIGVISFMKIYPLNLDGYGFLQILISSSLILAPLAALGTSGVIIRFFPDFKETAEDRAAFLTFLIVVGIGGMALLSLLYLLLGERLLAGLSNAENNFDLYQRYAWVILLLSALQVLSGIMESYTMNFHRIAVPTVATTFLPKICIPLIVYGQYYFGWTIGQTSYALLAMYGAICAFLMTYLYWLKELRFSLAFKRVLYAARFREMMVYAGYALLGGLGGRLALQIDVFSLGAYVNVGRVGAYNQIVFSTSLLTIPYYAMTRIASPIIAEALSNDDLPKVSDIYARTSNTLTFIGAAGYALVGASLADVFVLTGKPELYTGGVMVFLVLGAARVIDLVGSVNGFIISYSRYFRVGLLLVLALAGINIVLNWLFIGRMKMELMGAALASLIAMTIFNLFKSGFVRWKLKMHPFTRTSLLPIPISVLLVVVWMNIDLATGPIISIIVRSSVTGLVFLAYLWFTPFQPEIRGWLRKQLVRVFNVK